MKDIMLIPVARGNAYAYNNGEYVASPYARPGMYVTSKTELAYQYRGRHVYEITRQGPNEYNGRLAVFRRLAGSFMEDKGLFSLDTTIQIRNKREGTMPTWGGGFIYFTAVGGCMFGKFGLPRGLIAKRSGFYASSNTMSHVYLLDEGENAYYRTACHVNPKVDAHYYHEYLMLHPVVECSHCRKKIKNGLSISGFLDAQRWR